MAKLIPLQLPPGMMGNGTDYDAKGRWRDGNLVRWYNGLLRPVGGWMRFTPAPLPEIVRALQTWRDNDGYARLAMGTASKLYIHDGAIASDITPVGLVPGRENGNVGLGYGADEYGEDEYGTPRTSSGLTLDATVWDLDNFGQDLIAFSPADGRIFKWTPPNAGVKAAVIHASAPIDNRAVLSSDERHLVALGADGDGRRVTWCSQEDATQWTATATNTAGSLQLHTNGSLMNGRRLPGEMILWTDTDLHSMRYQGPPFVYGTQRVGTNCGLIGRHAHASAGDFVAWMGQRSFFIYDGNVKPLPSEVQERVFNDLNYLQASKIVASNNSQYGEVWWFYPSADSMENDRYVIWNYKEQWWATGQLGRTAWADREVWPYPLAAAPDGNLYQQEQGWSAGGGPRFSAIYAESGPVDIGTGDQTLAVQQLIPDNSGDASLAYTFTTKQTPNGPATVAGPYGQLHGQGYIDVRFTGRQAVVKVAPQEDGLFHLGTLRLDGTMGGRR